MVRAFEALYFPYASVRSTSTLKSLLLYFDKVWVISSHEARSRVIGEFAQLLDEGEFAGWVDGERLVGTSYELLEQAIETDLRDPEFLALTARRRSTWELYADKGVMPLADVLRPTRSAGPTVQVAYDRGESFLLNMTVLALTKGTEPRQRLEAVPLTDDEEHLTVLHHKLRRGAAGQLERLYGQTLERATKEQLVASIGRAALQTVLPDPEELEGIALERIVSFRREHERERRQLRDAVSNAIAEIVEEHPDASAAHLHERVETLLNVSLRELEHEASWTTRVLRGFRTVLKASGSAVRNFNVFAAGVSPPFALAGAVAEAGGPIAKHIEEERDLLRTSDVTYLYKAKKVLRPT